MRKPLVELTITYGTRRIVVARELVDAWRNHARVEQNVFSTDREHNVASARLSSLLADERELTEKQAAVASMLTKAEIEYVQGEIGRTHTAAFGDEELREAVEKVRDGGGL